MIDKNTAFRIVKAKRSIQSNKDSDGKGKFGLLGSLTQEKTDTQSEKVQETTKKPENFKFSF